MKVHVAEIFNFACDRNSKHWWSVDGIRPEIGQVLLCPWCGYRNVVTEFVNHTVTLPSVEVEAIEQKLPTIDEMIGILNVEGGRGDSAQSDTSPECGQDFCSECGDCLACYNPALEDCGSDTFDCLYRN